MKKNIEVSICCITYNQEKYIRKAIESFLNQKADFNYEIVIHDEASTDNTVSILKEYKEKYPEKIVLILEKENQYSKNPNSVLEIVFKKARGKYIAVCEGDDYYCDENKINHQYQIMKTGKYSLCSHDIQIVDENSSPIEIVSPYQKNIVTITNFLKNKRSMHASSIFFAKKDILKLPQYFKNSLVGDLPLKLYLLSIGNCYHIKAVYSCYRTYVPNSWNTIQKKNRDIKYRNFISEINTYKDFNKTTNYKYDQEVDERIKTIEFNYYKDINNLKKIKNTRYIDLYKKLSYKEKLKLYIKQTIIYKIYCKIKYKQ